MTSTLARAFRGLTALFGALALCVPAAAQSVLKQHQFHTGTSFCCSGALGFYSSPWVDTDGRIDSPVGYSWGDFASTVAPGSFSASIRLQAQTVYGVHVRFLGGDVWNISNDTLFAGSSSLPIGTPVTLRFTLRIDGDWGADGRSLMNVAGLAQVESSAGYPGQRVAVVESSSLLLVGGSWNFGTQYRVFGDGFANTNDVKDGGSWDRMVSGDATLRIEVLDADVDLTSASGHNYAIPEPGTWALMLVGIAAVGRIAQRRRAAIG